MCGLPGWEGAESGLPLRWARGPIRGKSPVRRWGCIAAAELAEAGLCAAIADWPRQRWGAAWTPHPCGSSLGGRGGRLGKWKGKLGDTLPERTQNLTARACGFSCWGTRIWEQNVSG